MQLHLHAHIGDGILAHAPTLPGAVNAVNVRFGGSLMAQTQHLACLSVPGQCQVHQHAGAPPHLGCPQAGAVSLIALPPAPGAAWAARNFTSAALREWGLAELAQDAVLVASELVGNAIRHGAPLGAGAGEHPPVELSWSPQATRLVCAVTDWNTSLPVLMPAGPCAESGRGLQLIDALSAAWGWAILGACHKTVWAALRLPAPAQPAT